MATKLRSSVYSKRNFNLLLSINAKSGKDSTGQWHRQRKEQSYWMTQKPIADIITIIARQADGQYFLPFRFEWLCTGSP